MKITAFNGSPRGERSVTSIMVTEFLKGAQDAGAETEHILLARKDIRHCRGCFACWTTTPGKCAIDDDMKGLIPKFVASDVAVIATPLYVDNVCGITKDFLDRLIPILDAHFEKDNSGECRHDLRYGKSPKLVILSNSGFPEQSHFQVLRLLFRRVALNIHSEVLAEVYRPAGPVLKYTPKEAVNGVAAYKLLLRNAGSEIARGGKLTKKTINGLEKPILKDEDYIRGANEDMKP